MFKIPFTRHLVQLVLQFGLMLGIGYHFGSKEKAEIKGELNATKKESDSNKEDIKELRAILAEIAQQPRVNNEIQGVKVKDGSQLHFAPESDVSQITAPDPVEKQKALPLDVQIQIIEKQLHLDKLKKEKRRPKKQRKLQMEINDLQKPP